MLNLQTERLEELKTCSSDMEKSAVEIIKNLYVTYIGPPRKKKKSQIKRIDALKDKLTHTNIYHTVSTMVLCML